MSACGPNLPFSQKTNPLLRLISSTESEAQRDTGSYPSYGRATAVRLGFILEVEKIPPKITILKKIAELVRSLGTSLSELVCHEFQKSFF